MVNMKITWQLALCSLLLLIKTTTAFSIKVDTLYTAKIPVNTQSAQERNGALRQAIGQVLIKVSGSEKIINNPELKSKLDTGDNIIQEFSYSSVAADKPSYLLELQLDNNMINQWLRDASAPIWGQNRPLILSLMTLTTPGHPQEIISNSSTNDVAKQFIQDAEYRGIPITLPLMDVTDNAQIKPQDITAQQYSTDLIQTAKRYGSDALLLGSISQDASQYTSHWKLILNNEQWEWSLTAKSSADIIAAIINNVTDTLAKRYAIITTNQIQDNLNLKVTGIRQQADFVQLIRYLNHLTPVADVSITEIAGDNIILNISLRSTKQSFIQAMTLDKKLIPTPVANAENTSLFIYQWDPS